MIHKRQLTPGLCPFAALASLTARSQRLSSPNPEFCEKTDVASRNGLSLRLQSDIVADRKPRTIWSPCMFEGAAVMTAIPLPQKRGLLPAGQWRFMASARTIAALVRRETAPTCKRSQGGMCLVSVPFAWSLGFCPCASNNIRC